MSDPAGFPRPVAGASDPSRISFWKWLGGIAVGAAILRVAYILVMGPHLHVGLDATWYGFQAGNLADGVGFVDPAAHFWRNRLVPTANFPPLWPMLLAVPTKLGLGSLRELQMTGALVGTGTVIVTGALARALVSARVGLVAAGIVAISPAMLAADGSLMSDSLAVLLVLAAALTAVQAARSDRLLRWVACGLLLGLAALARSDVLVLVPFVLGAFVIAGRDRDAVRRRLVGIAVAAGCVAIPLVPWAARNRVSMGEWEVMTANSGSTLAGANCPSTYSGDLLGYWDNACVVQATPNSGGEFDRAQAQRDAALRYATGHLSRLPVVASVRVLRAWGLYDPIEQARQLDSVETRNGTWEVISRAGSYLLLGLGGAGWLYARRRRIPVRILTALVAGATLVVVISYGNPRFVLVALPALAILAALRVDGWIPEPAGDQNLPVRP